MENIKKPILQVKNLKTFLKLKKLTKVVNDISFNLYPGKTLALVGESGCGKSMTALSLMQLIPKEVLSHYEGQILFNQENLLHTSNKKFRKIRGKKISMIFQNPTAALDPLFTIGNQLLETLLAHENLEEEEAYEKILNALKTVRITSPKKRLSAYPHELSGGMLQRVMIAMALLLQPDILIADEPTTALDVTVQTQVLDLIKEREEATNMATLLITHDMGVVASVADEVMVMYATEGIEQGTVTQIFKQPQHPYTRALFATLPKVKGTKLQTIQGMVPPITELPKGCHFHPRCVYATEACKQQPILSYSIEENHWNRCILFKEGKWPY